MPWPSHLFLSSRETLRAKSSTIRHFLCYCNRVAADFVLDITGQSVEYLVERYEMNNDEAVKFLAQAAWHFAFDVHESMLSSLFAFLEQLKIVPGNWEAALRRYLSHVGRVTSHPAVAKPWWAHDMTLPAQENTRSQRVPMAPVPGPTYDTDETSEGASPLPLSGPRSHRLIPACHSSASALEPSTMLGRGKCNIFHAREALAPVAPPDSPLSNCTISPRGPFAPSIGGCFVVGDMEGEPVPAG